MPASAEEHELAEDQKRSNLMSRISKEGRQFYAGDPRPWPEQLIARMGIAGQTRNRYAALAVFRERQQLTINPSGSDTVGFRPVSGLCC
jgi:hypothetical protein